jgi:hypothetical protein
MPGCEQCREPPRDARDTIARMPNDDGHKAGREHNEKEITTDHLRELLYDITYHWNHNQNAMRKTRHVLIKLIGEFARADMRKFDREKARQARKR